MLVQATTKNYNRLFTSLILNEVKDAEALRKALEANDEATTYMPGDAEVERHSRNRVCTTSSPRASSICWKAPFVRA